MPSARQLTLAPAARADLQDIWHHYAAVASADQADRMTRQVWDAIVGLDRLELPGRARDELVPGVRSVLARPYVVFFRIQADRVEIARILHERRDIAALISKTQE